jgi:hypothetical protein
VIQSKAATTCVAGPGGLAPSLTGSSSIRSLKFNGLTVAVGSAPLTIPLVIGSPKLNSKQAVGGVVVQQAVALDTPLAHIVLAESKADVHGICTPA